MSPASERPRRLGEFELIAKLFAPLSKDFAGAFGLTDDAAVLSVPDGQEIVLKTDSLIERVHFLRNDPPFDVSRKALRRALSDLAAKGADPRIYLLALALPEWPDLAWLESFAAGLAADQKEFGIALAGGETNATPGALTVTITAVGEVPSGTMIRRAGAQVGDGVFVTGTIGDAAGGLCAARGDASQLDEPDRARLLGRYRLPEPRLAFGRLLRGVATASLDVSDGLLADLGHIADVSGVRVEIEAERIPLSVGLRKLWRGRELVERAASGGDDYEIAFTAPASATAAVEACAARAATPATRIGSVVAGWGVALLDREGGEMAIAKKGYVHF